MTIDHSTIQLFIGGFAFVTLLAVVAAKLPKPPRTVELRMHVDRGSGRGLDIVISGACDDDVEAMLAGVARRIADGDPATVRTARRETPVRDARPSPVG